MGSALIIRVGGQDGHTVREFARITLGALGLDWRRHAETDQRSLNRIPHPLRGDSTKPRLVTGWSPSVTFAELVARLVQEAMATPQTELAS